MKPLGKSGRKVRCEYRCHACRNRCKGAQGHSSPFHWAGHFCKNHKRARVKISA